ncbi:hypothetical protein HII31_13762 [Pseudocercospora fuligena]|uniref:Uncharacterized protein n=1 Tax=Pseudocercospora fuligena TaxID=685502 RepID=A0A8H6R2V6_9PEZI|nr:hypothetical protein HII31_13762 [Pseudocercospora fuligena]
MTQHAPAANGVSRGTKRRSDTVAEPPRKSKSPTKWDEVDDSNSRSRGNLPQGDGAEQKHCDERSGGDNTRSTPETATHGFKQTTKSTDEALGLCLKILSGKSIPPLLLKPTTQTVLDDLILPKVRLSEPASIKRAFTDLKYLLDAYEIIGAGAERVMVMLRTETRKILNELSSAAMDTEDTATAHAIASQSNTHESLEPASLERRNGVQCPVASTVSGSKHSSENDDTAGLELQRAVKDTQSGAETPGTSVVESSPHSTRLRSHFFFTGSGTDARSPVPDTATSDHSDEEDARSPTQRKSKRREWSKVEEDVVLNGIRHNYSSSLIAEDLAKVGVFRTTYAINNRRAVLQKRFPIEYLIDGPDLESDTIGKLPSQKAIDLLDQAVAGGSRVVSKCGFTLTSGPRSSRGTSIPAAIAWQPCEFNDSDPDVVALYLPINTLEFPVSPDSRESFADLEQACLEAFKGGERSFRSVQRVAQDFWVVKCKTPQFGFRELLECPILHRGLVFYAEYLPIEAPKTFAADVEGDAGAHTLKKSFQRAVASFGGACDLALQLDPTTSARKLVAYFATAPGLMRFYVPLNSPTRHLCFKPVETFGTCWLCHGPHGDQRCSLATSL